MDLLASWWNRSWGTWNCKRVWLEQCPGGGPFVVRWRGGDWRDRDGRYVTFDDALVIAALKTLLGADKSAWSETIECAEWRIHSPPQDALTSEESDYDRQVTGHL